ncbi:MAG: SDR family NAD(P)-dependent oxidoreductase [Candidatus Limivicinus sp.]
MGRLKDKVCIVTGGNSGIGMKTAQVFAGEGAKLVLTDVSDSNKDKVLKQIHDAGTEAIFVRGDITNAEDNQKLMQAAVEAFGKIDVLVNCAGVLEKGLKPIEEFTDSDYDFVSKINIKGTMSITREACKIMAAQKHGNIISVASISGKLGCGGAVYTATKGAVVALTRHIALRFAGQGIRANCVCPGTVWTPMTKNQLKEERSPAADEFYDIVNKHSDLDVGICKDIDIANILLFLASEESRVITGQAIDCDCGCYL